ncbi:MAG TPA: hypothetical protein VK204_07185 [Nocardioidaceae bacterium]|nr:hypothetical protein [Nocardioidaceae bacterium]
MSVGGGIGSFVTVDYLRIAGVPSSQIRVLTPLEYPWETYEYLTGVSQIPRGERLRSDSASTPDNIWGFPSYAVREAFAARSLRGSLAPLWQVLTEPIFADYYTPRAGQVFTALQREYDRIGYAEMCERGVVRTVRRRQGGGYFTILTRKSPSGGTRRVAFRGQFVHVAVGYPGLKYLPDLQDYRLRTGDHHRVVNAYEPHEHLYQELRSRQCTVVIRGGGIVASRILQRLIDDRDRYGTDVRIVHLFRTFISGSHGPSIFMRRRGGDGWAYQGFNYPKSAWGGQLKAKMRKLEGGDRAELYKLIGGTNTPHRRLWMRQLARGRSEGWYRTVTGEVEKVGASVDGKTLSLRVRNAEGVIELPADFIVDCTGLEADIAEHRVLKDLLDHCGAQRNPLGRLDVERSFEVRGMRSGNGRAYASGAATLGGYFPGVDTFLGLQISAQEICDDLARIGFCRRIGVWRSTSQWWRWVRNRRI